VVTMLAVAVLELIKVQAVLAVLAVVERLE
jgi:hypothetical protein